MADVSDARDTMNGEDDIEKRARMKLSREQERDMFELSSKNFHRYIKDAGEQAICGIQQPFHKER